MYLWMLINMSLKSKAGVAKPNSKSLRATIPEGIVAFLELRASDTLEWKMEIINGKRVTIVQKYEEKPI